MPIDDNRVSAADAAYIAKLLSQDAPADFAAVQRWRDDLQVAINDIIIKRVEPVLTDMLEFAPQDTLRTCLQIA